MNLHGDALAVPRDDEGEGRVQIGGRDHRAGGLDACAVIADGRAVDFDEDVADLQRTFGGGRVRIDMGDAGLVFCDDEVAQQQGAEHEGQQKVHCRACGDGEQALPHRLVVHGVGGGILLVFAHEGAVAAQGDQAQGIGDALAPETHELRTEAHGKLHDADAAQAPHQIVAKFMYGDDEAEHDDGDQDIENFGHQYLRINSLAHARAASSA